MILNKRIINIIKSSVRATLSYKLRTFFSLLSVAMAIASIILIVAAVEGAYKKALEIIERFGPDSVLVLSGSDEARAAGMRLYTLTKNDAYAIQNAFHSAYLVVPMRSVNNVQASYRNKKHQTRVIGSTPDYINGWSWSIEEGSNLTDIDIKGFKNACIIRRYVSKMLFEDISSVGKFILVNKLPCQIIGILSERHVSQIGVNLDDRIIMPITTVMKKLLNESKYLSAIKVRFRGQERVVALIEQLRLFLRERHGLKDTQNDDFRMITPDRIVRFLVTLTGSLVVFLGVTGIVSLIVSGFVLANLFLLSVKERTYEIGIRRASGAKKKDIIRQFLIESTIITTSGGVVGFLLGIVFSKFLVLIADFPLYFSWKAFLTGLLLSVSIGIIFGIQPAKKAANLTPAEAVR